MRKVTLLAALIASSIILAGCEGLWMNKIETSRVKADIEENNSFYDEEPAAIYVDAPSTQQLEHVKIKIAPSWAESEIRQQQLDGAPLHYVMKNLLTGLGVNYQFGQEANPNTPVTAKISGTVKDGLETISAVTGLTYEMTSDSVKWSEYVTESFSVGYIPGKNSYRIGSTPKETSGGSGSAEQISFGTDTKQFSSITDEGQDPFTEMQSILDNIVGEFGTATISRSTNSVIVTTTNSRMHRVKIYMAEVERALGRQVAFEIKFFRFTSSRSGSAGIDWNYVRQRSKGVLNFDGGDLSSLTSGGTPITFSATKSTGSEAGSNVLLGILQQQGAVSVVNQPRVVTQINRVAELELSSLTGYIAKTEVTQSGGLSASGPTVTLTPGVVESGYTLYAMANITGKDKIILHMASTYTDLMGIERKEVLDSAIESPNMSRNKMVSTTVLRNGETMIIGGLQMRATNETNQSPFSPTVMPTRNSHNGKITETIALVTPIILDMN